MCFDKKGKWIMGNMNKKIGGGIQVKVKGSEGPETM